MATKPSSQGQTQKSAKGQDTPERQQEERGRHREWADLHPSAPAPQVRGTAPREAGLLGLQLTVMRASPRLHFPALKRTRMAVPTSLEQLLNDRCLCVSPVQEGQLLSLLQ